MSNRILFVDDETMLLKGLERSLRSMRRDWEMHFVTGGPEALQAMERGPFDVVISDMRMPGMDGAELLDQVRSRFPQTVRMVLSGQSDKEAVLRAIRPTHQYLSKPCDIEELKQKVTRALSLRDLLEGSKVKQKVSQLETVPSLSVLHSKLRNELESAHPSLQEVSDIVIRDPGMCAKLLQLINSAFLGAAKRVSCPKEAVTMIGLDNFRTLVRSGSLLSELPASVETLLGRLWPHAYCTARCAEAIARCEHADNNLAQDCFAAGLLHDIGWVVLAATDTNQFAEQCGKLSHQFPAVEPERLERENFDHEKVERETEVFGATHALAGAYLLGLWGLPDSIVQTVANHHAPARTEPNGFCALIAVRVAERWDGQRRGFCLFTEGDAIDEALLGRIGLRERLPVWLKRCDEIENEVQCHA